MTGSSVRPPVFLIECSPLVVTHANVRNSSLFSLPLLQSSVYLPSGLALQFSVPMSGTGIGLILAGHIGLPPPLRRPKRGNPEDRPGDLESQDINKGGAARNRRFAGGRTSYDAPSPDMQGQTSQGRQRKKPPNHGRVFLEILPRGPSTSRLFWSPCAIVVTSRVHSDR